MHSGFAHRMQPSPPLPSKPPSLSPLHQPLTTSTHNPHTLPPSPACGILAAMQASPSSTGAAAALPLQTRLFHAALERVERHLHRLQVEEAQVQSEEHEVAQFAVLYRTPPSDPPPPSAVTPLLLRLSLLRQDLLLHPHLPPQPTPSSILSPPAFLSSSPSSSSSTPSSLLQQQSTLRSLQSSALSLSSSLISRTAHTRAQRQTALPRPHHRRAHSQHIPRTHSPHSQRMAHPVVRRTHRVPQGQRSRQAQSSRRYRGGRGRWREGGRPWPSTTTSAATRRCGLLRPPPLPRRCPSWPPACPSAWSG